MMKKPLTILKTKKKNKPKHAEFIAVSNVHACHSIISDRTHGIAMYHLDHLN